MKETQEKKNYKVLARKYRPTDFSNLIGQESLVEIMTNAIKLARIPHAILLSGIRGVGKTTAARIIANIVNCNNNIGESKNLVFCGICKNCQAINNHPDIIEIDAASKTGVNDIREIIENANYLPLLGNYKIYIIDEIHMLSNNAFNALLKTLEEPPKHVIFIFATTELRKIPVTILSRCMRFDLKRISDSTLFDYLKKIANLEKLEIDDEAIKIIVNNSEGSLRDSLSLLDQAVNISLIDNSSLTEISINQMLGYSNDFRKYELINNIIKSNVNHSIDLLNELYYDGYNPIILFEELLGALHILTKYIITSKKDNLNSNQIKFIQSNSEIKISYLSSLWQMINKGIEELKIAKMILQSAEMIIIRLCYSANIPSISELIDELNSDANSNSSKSTNINSFSDIIDLCKDKKEMMLHHYLISDIFLVDFKQYNINININGDLPKNIITQLEQFLLKETGDNWIINVKMKINNSIIEEEMKKKDQQILIKWSNDPMIKIILDNFQNSSIKKINNKNILH